MVLALVGDSTMTRCLPVASGSLPLPHFLEDLDLDDLDFEDLEVDVRFPPALMVVEARVGFFFEVDLDDFFLAMVG